jgi:AbrB family looped-hinge helix DNA binding protein
VGTVRRLSKGRIVIPAGLRKKFRIEPGTEMQIMEYGGIICLIPPGDDPVSAACGALPTKPSLGDRFLLDREN